MKRKSLLSLIFVSLVGVLGLSSIASISLNKEAKEVDASTTEAFSGMYEKVTDVSDLANDNEVLIVSDDGDVLRDLGGNPGFLYTTKDRVHLSKNKRFVYVDNAYVTPQTIKIHDTNQFSFYGSYNPFSRFSINGYLSYDNRGSAHVGGNIDYQVNIQYYMEAFGLRKDILDDSSFTLSYHDGHMYCTNVGGHGVLAHVGGSNARLYLNENWTNINLYKKTTVISATFKSGPADAEYDQGEKIDLSGLVVTVHISGSYYDASYNDDPGFFQCYEYVTGVGNVNHPVTYAGATFDVPIAVFQTGTKYGRVTKSYNDWSGDYYLATEIGNTKYLFNGYDNYGQKPFTALFTSSSGNQFVDVDPSTSVYQGLSLDGYKERATMHIYKSFDPFYRLRYETHYYMLANNDGSVSYRTNATESSLFSFVYDSVNKYAYVALVENSVVTNKVLSYSSTNNRAMFVTKGTANTSVFRLYKTTDLDSVLDGIKPYVNGMRDLFSNCNDKGEVNFAVEYANRWSTLGATFLGLNAECQGYLGNIVYTHGQEERDSLEDLINRYDYIVLKYDSINDFMQRRGIAEQLQPQLSAFVESNRSVTTDVASIVVIAVIGISVTFILARFFIRRKEQQ